MVFSMTGAVSPCLTIRYVSALVWSRFGSWKTSACTWKLQRTGLNVADSSKPVTGAALTHQAS